LQAIAHASIPKVFDLYDTPGQCCLVMELPSGEFLDRLTERSMGRRFAVETALTITREIGVALAHAHDRGIVHGGLHTGSVLITQSGALRVFGLAQADAWIVGDGTDDGNYCSLPVAVRHYSSPQRLHSEFASTYDDVYSLAAIAYELLIGRPIDHELLRAFRSGRPGFAEHLSQRQWGALRRALGGTPAERGDIRSWLAELDMEKALWRLPQLAEFGADIHHERVVKRTGLRSWFRADRSV